MVLFVESDRLIIKCPLMGEDYVHALESSLHKATQTPYHKCFQMSGENALRHLGSSQTESDALLRTRPAPVSEFSATEARRLFA